MSTCVQAPTSPVAIPAISMIGNERIHYLAYGSNLHPLRLTERIPSARLVGTVKLPAWRLLFHKRSADCSGKCDLVYSGSPADTAYGAIYSMAAGEKGLLDEFEACGRGYRDVPIEVECGEKAFRCFTYSAQADYIDASLRPYPWYKELVYLGAHHHRFPAEYLERIEAVETVADRDARRCAIHGRLIERIRSAHDTVVTGT